MDENVETIDITPSTEGFIRSLAVMADSVRRDTAKHRQADTAALLGAIVEIAYSLGTYSDASVETRARLVALAEGSAR